MQQTKSKPPFDDQLPQSHDATTPRYFHPLQTDQVHRQLAIYGELLDIGKRFGDWYSGLILLR